MSIGIWELLLILVIVLILFGGSRLRNLGSDLGTAIRGFRDAMKENAKPDATEDASKKLEQLTAEERKAEDAATVHDSLLAKTRDKV